MMSGKRFLMFLAIVFFVMIPWGLFGAERAGSVRSAMDDDQSWLRKAEEAVAQGKFGEAIEECNRRIARFPNDALAYNNRGTLYAMTGDYKRALADHSKAVSLAPDDATYLGNRAAAYRATGQPDLAIQDATSALTIDPTERNAHLTRARAFTDKGLYDGAMADYNRLLKMGMQTVDIHSGRADVFMKKGEYDRALSEYGTALKLDPSNGIVYTGRSLVHWLKGMQDAALADARRATQLNPDYSEAYFHLGFYLHERKAVNEARSSFLKSMELTPDIVQSHENVWFEALGPGYGTLLKKEVGVAKSYLAATGGSRKPPVTTSREAPPQSILHIRSVQLTPATVKPGAPFDIRIEYSATDRAIQGGMLAVDLSLTIMDGPSILFNLAPTTVQTQNGQMAARVEHLTASPKKGVYMVQAIMRYKGAMHTIRTELRVE